MTARTRSQIGRSNRDRGNRYESKVTKYLQEHGHPHAERRQSGGPQDRGDIVLHDADGDRWVIDTKTLDDVRPGNIERCCRQVELEAENAGAPFWALVVDRKGTADVGASFVWLPLGHLLSLWADVGAARRLDDELVCVTLRAFAALVPTRTTEEAL